MKVLIVLCLAAVAIASEPKVCGEISTSEEKAIFLLAVPSVSSSQDEVVKKARACVCKIKRSCTS